MNLPTNVWTVFLAALGTALATGLGALPFLFLRNLSRKWLGIANGLASGLMLGASFGLIIEGLEYTVWLLFAGAFAGIGFIFVSQRWLKDNHRFEADTLEGADALKIFLIVGVMTVHSFAEGISVGVSFGGGQQLGLLIAAAIAVHNIPEGLAISLTMVPRGTSVGKAALWSIFSSLPQPLMAVPAFLFVSVFRQFLPFGLGFAAGAMIWMVFVELIPEALDESPVTGVALAITISMLAMIAFMAYV